MAGRYDWSATSKKAVSVPVANATMYSCQIVKEPATKATGIESRTTPRPMSAATSTGRRRTRSSQAPAGRVKSRNGIISTAVKSETWKTFAPSIVSAMKGTAKSVTWLPNMETVAADQIFTKSRCRKSDGRVIPVMPASDRPFTGRHAIRDGSSGH